MPDKIAFFWNQTVDNSIDTDSLYDDFIADNIQNENFNEFFKDAQKDKCDLFTQRNEVIDDEGNINFSTENYSALFILAELEWDSTKPSDFYGIKLAQKLRLKDVNLPIFICSYFPKEFLIKEKQFHILNFRGHYFIQIPELWRENDKITSLEPLEMMDVKSHYCGLEGTIRDKFHKKQHAINYDKLEDGKKFLNEIFNDIKQLSGLPQKVVIEIDKLIYRLKNEVKSKKELERFCWEDESKILDYLDNKETSIKSVQKPEGNWEILILDDVPDDVAKLKDRLAKEGVSNIHLAQTYEEAMDIIRNDLFNRIAVVISDYRLEKDKKIKGKQGYSFIKWLSEQNRINEFFVFSGLARKFLKDTFNSYSIRVNVLSKYEVHESRFDEFVDDIIEKGNLAYDALLSQPSAAQWRNALRYYYAYYRSLFNYEDIERSISFEAKRYVNQVNYYWNLKRHNVEENDNWFYNLLRETQIIEPIPKLRTKLSAKDNKEKKLDTFKNILLARRIHFYLMEYLKLFKNRKIMTGILRDGNFTPADSQTTKQVYYFMGIDENDFPTKLLVEEKNWFNNIMNEIIEDPASMVERESIIFFQEIINQLNVLLNDQIKVINKSAHYEMLEPYLSSLKSKKHLVCNNLKDLEDVFVLLKRILGINYEKLVELEALKNEIIQTEYILR